MELQESIIQAFEYIKAIPVTGDAVELMAAAKDALRRAYKLAGDKTEDKTDAEKSCTKAEAEAKKAEGSCNG